ncbi:hypothetical protein DZF91_09005 [Actinomadura logoneensis]|uniref:Hemophore-related protein n=1 Tax=Actinomadura logoneensis TaxID=2293572 RepID=A0A372JPM2_9ACTN|nr:hypothetical protein [Actinomadura logoneensis]RFU41981.1 hypothetical protein DZF91_09005 [Actinomadura logoneensis]
MNVRAMVIAAACALSAGAVAVPAQAAAPCDFTQANMTIEQAVSKLGRPTQQRFRSHPLYNSFKHRKLSTLPAGVRADFRTACQKRK